MVQAIRIVFYAIVLNGLMSIAIPPVQRSLYVAHLLRLAPPATLRIPVDHVPARSLRNSWHAPRDINRRHEGIDIFAPRGTPVRATTQGIVTRAGNNRLGGKTVWVLGPSGQLHYYAHLEQFADVRPGQRIEAGTLLGYVGNSGNARGTPPHLHYGIYERAGAINPFPLLKTGTSSDTNGEERPAEMSLQVKGTAKPPVR